MKSYKIFALFMLGMIFTEDVSAKSVWKKLSNSAKKTGGDMNKINKQIDKAFSLGHLDRIKIKNESGKPMKCQLAWKNRNGGHNIISGDSSLITVKSSDTGEAEGPLVGYGIHRITVYQQNKGLEFDTFVYDHLTHGNTYFVINKDAQGNRTVVQYADEDAYKKGQPASV